MSLRHTYVEVRDYIGRPIGLCGDNPDLLPLVNEASEVLWAAGDWIHKMARYKMRVIQGCNGNIFITWPPQVETIEAIQSCNAPIGVRNIYFEFISNGPGNLDTANQIAAYQTYGLNGWYGGGRLLGDRDEVCTSEDVWPGSKLIKAYNSLPADDDVQIILMGYDDNNQWIRTLVNGSYVDGEYLTLSAASPPSTANFFSSITGVQFSKTPRNGTVTITEVATLNSNTERTLSTYGYNEEVPIYRRSILTGFENTNCCSTVVALCRMRYQPIINDTDYLQIGNIAALKTMLISLNKRDNGLTDEAEKLQMKAQQILDNELRQYQGIGAKKIVSFQPRSSWGASYNIR